MSPEWIRGPGYRSVALSHAGCRRANNEDNFGQSAELHLVAVADGMGGHERGEVASRLAVETVLRKLGQRRPLADAVKAANDYVCKQDSGAGLNMGTTLVAVQLEPDSAGWHAVWVGDSRIYRLRAGELEQISSDHTLVNELMATGLLNEEEARNHPERHRLTRALGGGQCEFPLEVDERAGSCEPGDIFLLCSDGLSGVLDDATLCDTLLAAEDDLEHAAQSLLQQTLDGGAPDNVTMVLLQWLGEEMDDEDGA